MFANMAASVQGSTVRGAIARNRNKSKCLLTVMFPGSKACPIFAGISYAESMVIAIEQRLVEIV